MVPGARPPDQQQIWSLPSPETRRKEPPVQVLRHCLSRGSWGPGHQRLPTGLVSSSSPRSRVPGALLLQTESCCWQVDEETASSFSGQVVRPGVGRPTLLGRQVMLLSLPRSRGAGTLCSVRQGAGLPAGGGLPVARAQGLELAARPQCHERGPLLAPAAPVVQAAPWPDRASSRPVWVTGRSHVGTPRDAARALHRVPGARGDVGRHSPDSLHPRPVQISAPHGCCMVARGPETTIPTEGFRVRGPFAQVAFCLKWVGGSVAPCSGAVLSGLCPRSCQAQSRQARSLCRSCQRSDLSCVREEPPGLARRARDWPDRLRSL